jgi:hypothetical protein
LRLGIVMFDVREIWRCEVETRMMAFGGMMRECDRVLQSVYYFVGGNGMNVDICIALRCMRFEYIHQSPIAYHDRKYMPA